jgi:chemotaxis methyl-accepting protein methylase
MNATGTPLTAKNSLPTDFPIIGIGCSAGGLDALEKFFSHTLADSGIAYVVIQHLAPKIASALPELLQRFTSMQVSEATDGVVVKPDSIYVIPPNKDISLLHGKLRLFDPTEKHGLRLPIDFFLKTLAEDRKEKAIGVILSGMGSDGMLGMRAIREAYGLTLVQEPASASADAMPRCVIESGLADIVAIPEELPAQILTYLKHPATTLNKIPNEGAVQGDLEKIIILLRNHGGADFSLYKTNTITRRVERRITLHHLADIKDYVRFLRDNPHEIQLLLKELLIGVTNFFRDPEVWEYLRTEAIPALLAAQPAGATLRAWVPACSSGEEAYSLAMIFREILEKDEPSAQCQLLIYATDLDPEAIDKARKAFYHSNIAADVSPERLARFFVQEAHGYTIKKEIREMVVFANQNVVSDPPFTKLDILCCRNLLIYFRAQLQSKLLPLFHYALNDKGLLLLGSAESIGNFSHLFVPVNHKARLYQRINNMQPTPAVEFPSKMPSGVPRPATEPLSAHGNDAGRMTEQLLLQSYAPAAVLVNADGDILFISGRTGKYLEPAAGKTNNNIYAMAREGLREVLTGVIHRALREQLVIHLNGLRIGTNGGTQTVDVSVQAIDKPKALHGQALIVFKDVATPTTRRKSRKSVDAETNEVLAQELQQTREALQVTHEEMQTSVEELKSSNEELQSTNEELQSTNEELTTSKEELQSLNEELQTVNAELQSKVENLVWVKNDMTNLINSTELATIFLDNDMKVRRFTPHVESLFKLISSDIGRPLSDITSDLDYPQLKSEAQEVLRTLVFKEGQVGTHDGRWYRMRIMPYRTQDNVIDGVVITFMDISEFENSKNG